MRDGQVSDGISTALLRWYDGHARTLPWRVPPGSPQRADPYRVWLSEVMLQQTTVAAVTSYFQRFTTLWPDVAALAAARDAEVFAEWAGLGYYARARNLLKCARAVAEMGGFPGDEAGLRALPGIGPYTAAAIAAIAFGQRAVVVDGNVERVMARLFAHEVALPRARAGLAGLAATVWPQERSGDFAQALMDLGATICTPRNPRCMDCPLKPACAGTAGGEPTRFPIKAAKTAKPVRSGTLWVALRADGAVLLETRPEKGLLGGMAGLPGDGWDGGPSGAPLDLAWAEAGRFRHTFTHFHLDLTVLTAVPPPGANPSRGEFRTARPSDLPTLMKRALVLAQSAAFADASPSD